jgi:adenylate cyclase
MCGTRILEKTRHLINANDGLKWEVDVFAGRHAGLVLAEIELPSLDTNVELPEWTGEDVSEDPRYLNAVLAIPAE